MNVSSQAASCSVCMSDIGCSDAALAPEMRNHERLGRATRLYSSHSAAAAPACQQFLRLLSLDHIRVEPLCTVMVMKWTVNEVLTLPTCYLNISLLIDVFKFL